MKKKMKYAVTLWFVAHDVEFRTKKSDHSWWEVYAIVGIPAIQQIFVKALYANGELMSFMSYLHMVTTVPNITQGIKGIMSRRN